MTELREKIHICLYTDSRTLETSCVDIDEMTEDELDIFFEEIEWYFYHQGGQLRECDYCGKKYPYFPRGIPYGYCFSDDCLDKAHAATLQCHETRIKEKEEGELEASKRAEERAKEKSENQRLEVEHQEKIQQGFGHIYIIEAPNGLYKIGLTTTSVDKRVYNLNAMSPVPLKLVHSIASDQVRKAESRIHKRFSDKRTHGEWFELTQDDLDWLKSLMGYEFDRG